MRVNNNQAVGCLSHKLRLYYEPDFGSPFVLDSEGRNLRNKAMYYAVV